MIRVIESSGTAAENMAIDEAIMKHVFMGRSQPTLRLYSWNPSTVSIGYFQSIKAEVDTEKCKELGINIIRRQTGGGAVFHDHEITYSFIIPKELIEGDTLQVYEKISRPIIKSLNDIGIEAEFAPINDIIVNGKKISGCAQTVKDGVVLQHGTILLSVDVDKMFSCLKVPDEKMKDKIIKNVKERVTSVSDFVDVDANLIRKIKDLVIDNFSKEFGNDAFKEDLSETEDIMKKKLIIEKYDTENWNYQR